MGRYHPSRRWQAIPGNLGRLRWKTSHLSLSSLIDDFWKKALEDNMWSLSGKCAPRRFDSWCSTVLQAKFALLLSRRGRHWSCINCDDFLPSANLEVFSVQSLRFSIRSPMVEGWLRSWTLQHELSLRLKAHCAWFQALEDPRTTEPQHTTCDHTDLEGFFFAIRSAVSTFAVPWRQSYRSPVCGSAFESQVERPQKAAANTDCCNRLVMKHL